MPSGMEVDRGTKRRFDVGIRDVLKRKENEEVDGPDTLPPLSPSLATVNVNQRGGGLGTPTGAMTVISGFSDERDPIAAVLNQHGLGWPGMYLYH